MSYVWKGLKQPDVPYPARMFCEMGRHNYRWESEATKMCWRCGARNWNFGYSSKSKETTDVHP